MENQTNSEKNKEIQFLITGGTIDSNFDPSKDSAIIGEKTYVESYMKTLQLHNLCNFKTVFLKDSRDVRYKDRVNLLEEIKKCESNKIIITHGTYTMPDTGQYLKDNLKENKKIIILVGSMIPLKGFENSDAPFNLGYALSKVQDLAPGIYIAMNGKIFDPKKVDKNRLIARFEESGETQ